MFAFFYYSGYNWLSLIKIIAMVDLNVEHQEKQQEQARVMEFLSLFNEIDKHFDKILEAERFIPYNEKIKIIIWGKFSISRFVKIYQNDLKYFWELRNHISHGLKVDEYIYAIPTQRAIDKLAEFVEKIVSPPLCIDFFRKEVHSVHIQDSLKDLLEAMKHYGYTHVPVYSETEEFLWVVTESWILQRLSEQMIDDNYIDISKVRIEHIFISKSNKDFVFASSNINIYEADEIFTIKKKKGRGLWALFITENGTSAEPIIGMISWNDVALIDDFVI